MVFAKIQNSAKIGLHYDHCEVIEISSNLRQVVWSAAANEFNNVPNIALH